MSGLSTREKIRLFSLAFGRPINQSPIQLAMADRELLGRLLFEETIETLTKGLGLKVTVPGWDNSDFADDERDAEDCTEHLQVHLNEGQKYDPIESADGLGDVNVVIHFMAHWMGFNLDLVTDEIHESNMSKLDLNGSAIINGESPGFMENEPGYDPSKPFGKILKGPNFRLPNIAAAIGLTCTDEGCPHYGTIHTHVGESQPLPE